MSQKVSRKTINEEKDKRSTNSPVKDMKKKVAANAEKEKQAAAEKTDKVDKAPEKTADKTSEKSDKAEKSTDKKAEKKDQAEKSTDKKGEKKEHPEKKNDKAEQNAEKSKEESSSRDDKSGKSEKEKADPKKVDPPKQKQNGRDRVHNGVSDVTLGNGTDDVNGTVSADSEDDDVMLVIDDNDRDELFPELTYDDTSDVECFEPPTPDSAPSRSFTRRSQVKATRTPETPRPASDKIQDTANEEPKDSKVLKMKEDAPSTDRKLRSSDSPKPQEKKESDKKAESDNKQEPDKKEKEGKDVVGEKVVEDNKSQEEKIEMEVIVEVENNDGEECQRKTDTNYSKSRVKVSPYRRSMRLADQTNTSVLANYTGNNTTMEMDITETSSFIEESNLDDSSYLRGLRAIKGRSSYKQLKDINLKHIANRSVRSNTSANLSSPGEMSRPTGTVVGRKRKPEESSEAPAEDSKRLRVLERLERLAQPLRRVAHVTLPTAHRRNADIVGINTDLPLSAPVSTSETFDPETLKTSIPPQPIATPLNTQTDNKRCIIM